MNCIRLLPQEVAKEIGGAPIAERTRRVSSLRLLRLLACLTVLALPPLDVGADEPPSPPGESSTRTNALPAPPERFPLSEERMYWLMTNEVTEAELIARLREVTGSGESSLQKLYESLMEKGNKAAGETDQRKCQELQFQVMAYGIKQAKKQIELEMEMLKQPAQYQPLAETLALYCQSEPSLFPEIASRVWLPDSVAAFGPLTVRVTTNYARLLFGGGDFFYGYNLTKLESESDSATNHWQLSFFADGSKATNLVTVAIAATNRITEKELVGRLTAAYDRNLRSNRDNPALWQGKVQFLIRFQRLPEAVVAAESWRDACPNAWLPRFTLAHLKCRVGEKESGAREFADWVATHPDFSHYTCLFLFHMRESQTAPALAAIRKMLDQPFVETDDGAANKFYLGHNAARFAFDQGEYALCLAMLDKMLADREQEEGWEFELRKLRAATLAMLDRWEEAKPELAKMKRSDDGLGLEKEDRARDDRLKQALATRDRDFVHRSSNWLDELDSWFDPFNTNETEIHGLTSLPHPYPASSDRSSDSNSSNPVKP